MSLLRYALLSAALVAAPSLTQAGEDSPSTPEVAEKAAEKAEAWVPLFNGKDLTGWTPKFRGFKAGENYRDTFRVEDGILQVRFDKWDKFKGEFGHLFYKEELSHYRLRVEYRFVGEQVEGGPGWAWRNNGVMIHGQMPEEMQLNQDFPNSIEVQMLGAKEGQKRSTGNLCTPGTHVEIDGKLVKRHVINSTSESFPGDQWVTLEIEVHGGDVIRHFINGKNVMEYHKPQLNDGTILTKGSISIQAETAPCDIRKIELLKLPTPE